MPNKSGYNASLTVGTYTGASLTNVTATINGAPIETTDLSSKWVSRVAGPMDWTVTGTKNVATEVFLDLVATGSTAMTSLGVKVTNPTGSTVFSGVGFANTASLTFPQGPATETITLVAKGAPSKP